MIVQKRDIQILRHMYEQQFLLIEHVAEFFKNKNKSEAYRRIQEMNRAGLIYREPLFILGGVSAIRTTALGGQVACSEGGNVVEQVRRIDISTATHDALVTWVRLRLQEFWDGCWVPEHYLRTFKTEVIPDGLFVFESGKKIHIEVESTFKGKQRLLRIHRARMPELRQENGSLEVVLYIATHKKIEAQLQATFEEFPDSGALGLIGWDALKNQASPKVWTARGPVALFDRRSY